MVTATKKCDQLFREFSDRVFILDDEPYFTFIIPFLTIMVATTQLKIKISKRNSKTRFLFGLWWVRKNCRLFIQMFGFAVNRKRHLNKCIRHRPTLFIRSNYKGSDYVSWLDFIEQSFSAKSFSAISVSETSLS